MFKFTYATRQRNPRGSLVREMTRHVLNLHRLGGVSA